MRGLDRVQLSPEIVDLWLEIQREAIKQSEVGSIDVFVDFSGHVQVFIVYAYPSERDYEATENLGEKLFSYWISGPNLTHEQIVHEMKSALADIRAYAKSTLCAPKVAGGCQ